MTQYSNINLNKNSDCVFRYERRANSLLKTNYKDKGYSNDYLETGSVGPDRTLGSKLRKCCENDPLALLGQAV